MSLIKPYFISYFFSKQERPQMGLHCDLDGRVNKDLLGAQGKILSMSPSLQMYMDNNTGPINFALAFSILTVISSFSTQSGDTLCKWVRCSWRCILLLRTSWQRGQQMTGCTECCDRTCIWIRLWSLLL